MADFPYPKPVDPKSASSGSPGHTTKQCRVCFAYLPMSHFGTIKNSADGHRHICKACRSEQNAADWTRKYGRNKPLETEGPSRLVKVHNETILRQALTTSEAKIWAYQPETKRDFKVMLGIGSLGLRCLAIFDLDGRSFYEINYSQDHDPLELLAREISGFRLRLELTEVDLIAAKTLIYFI